MPKFSGVDSSIISGFSGKSFTQSSGISEVPASTSGILMCPFNSPVTFPFDGNALLSSYNNPVHMFQWSNRTDIVEMDWNNYMMFFLSSTGVLYVDGISNGAMSGVPLANISQFGSGLQQVATGVRKLGVYNSGAFIIKTDGTLWYCGSATTYLSSTYLGSSTSYYGFTQIGTDTDWYDIKCHQGYPYNAYAIKGSSGSRYLYSTGYGVNYATGQGNTTRLTSFTRVKSASNTDLNVSFDKIATCYGSALAISEGGALYSWGENGQKILGQGNSTTDIQYATRVGTDTDWDKIFINRYVALAIKTDGTLHASHGYSYYNNLGAGATNNGSFNQVGTDTDWEGAELGSQSTNQFNFGCFLKKNGSWYWYGYTYLSPGSWAGNTDNVSTTGPTALNTVLQKNDIAGTVKAVSMYYNSAYSTQWGVIFSVGS